MMKAIKIIMVVLISTMLLSCGDEGETPTSLKTLAYKNLSDATAFVLKQGADVNEVDDDGWTALHYAAKWNSYATAIVLIRHGANLNVLNNYGWTPLDTAAHYDHPSVVLLLEKAMLEELRRKY